MVLCVEQLAQFADNEDIRDYLLSPVVKLPYVPQVQVQTVVPKKLDLSQYNDISIWCYQRSQYLFVQQCIAKHELVRDEQFIPNKRTFKSLYVETLRDPVNENLWIVAKEYYRYGGITFEGSKGYVVVELQTREGERYASPVALSLDCALYGRKWFHDQFKNYQFYFDFWNLLPDYCFETSQGCQWPKVTFNTDPTKHVADLVGTLLRQPFCFSEFMEKDVPDEFFVEVPPIDRELFPIEQFYPPKPLKNNKHHPVNVKKEVEELEEFDGIGIHKWYTLVETRRYPPGSELWRQTVSRCTDLAEKINYRMNIKVERCMIGGIDQEDIDFILSLATSGDNNNNKTSNNNYSSKEISIDRENSASVKVVTDDGKEEQRNDFYAYKAGYCRVEKENNDNNNNNAPKKVEDLMCIIKLHVPEDAKVAFSNDGSKLRVNKATVVGIFPFQVDRISYKTEDELFNSCNNERTWQNLKYLPDLDVKVAFGWMFRHFTYVKGTQIEVSDFDPDINKTCCPGIHLHFVQSDAFDWHGILNTVPELIEGYDMVEQYE